MGRSSAFTAPNRPHGGGPFDSRSLANLRAPMAGCVTGLKKAGLTSFQCAARGLRAA